MKNITKGIICFCFSIAVSNCNSPEERGSRLDSAQSESIKNNCFDYPSAINSDVLQKAYDSARWTLFVWHCDWPYRPYKVSSSKIMKTFGQLPLDFDSLMRKHDTIEFYFRFHDRGTPIWAFNLKDHLPLINGVAFDVQTWKKLYLISSANYTTSETGPNSRFQYPMQPNVARYIDSNWAALDPCFRQLAEKLHKRL
jgi:hypothetical protein